MAIRTIDAFQGVEKGENGVDITQNTSVYSPVFNISDLAWNGTDMEVGFMVIADATTASNSVTITFEGSLDGKNFNSGVSIIATTDIGDGAADFGSFNVGIPYPFGRIKATENDNGAVVDLRVVLAMPVTRR